MNKYLLPPKKLTNNGIGVAYDHQAKCSVCEKNPAQIFFNANPSFRINQVFPCVECYEEKEAESINWYEQNPTSIFTDPHGQEVAVDQRGKHMKKNPYAYREREIDPHGWMKTHKKEFRTGLKKKKLI